MGNEHRTPECVFQLGEGEDWKLRVVPNKYPVVSPYSRDDTSGKKITIGSTRALQEANLNLAAVGYHEVIIETPVHNLCTADQGLEGVQRLVAAWRQRGRFHLENFEDLASMMFFKNQGKVAGASLYHPHAQAVALPIVPQNLDGLFRTALHYFEHNGASVWEHTVHDELEGGERVVDVNEHFVSYVPYAAKSPYYMRIVPLANSPYFFETTDAQLAAFAEVLWRALRRLHLLLGEPDYNLNVFSSPLPRGPYAAHDPRVFYRWHAAITPRLGAGAMAGFEFGSGMFSNSAFPEDNAAELRAVDLLLGPTTSGSPSSSSSALDDHDGKKK